MIRILWSFRVAAERQQEFVRVYGADGEWARLFRKGDGFLGTRLLRDLSLPRQYLTEDRWRSQEDFDRFKAGHRLEYEELDRRCEPLASEERLIGVFVDAG